MTERRPVTRLVWDQIRYQNKLFWRTPIAAFFTLVFPVMLLLLMGVIFGNDEVIPEFGVTAAQFFAPGLAVFAAVSASYTNIAIGTATARDTGVLKRVLGTPTSPSVYMAGRVGSSVYIAVLAVLIMMAVGIAFFGIQLIPRTLPSVSVTFLVGMFCFASLGFLVAAVSPTADASPAITNGTLLPIAFVSNVFIPLVDPPTWLEVVGDIFPLKPFADAFRDGFNPTLDGAQWHWQELGVMLAWGVVGAILAIRLFKWEPGEEGSRRSRRHKAAASP